MVSPSHGAGRASRASRGPGCYVSIVGKVGASLDPRQSRNILRSTVERALISRHHCSQKSITPPFFPTTGYPISLCVGPHRTGGSGERWARQQAASRQQPSFAGFFLWISLIYHYYASVKTLQAVAKELNGKLGEDWGWKGPRKGRGEGFAQAGSSSPCDWRPRNTRVGCGLMRLVLKLTSVRWSLMIWRPSQYMVALVGSACPSLGF